MTKALYITTTLPYVNADPHIGFALEIVHADIYARYRTLQGDDVFFNTGTDEHGQKIYEAAQKAAKKPVLTSDDHVRGNKNAKVALVNYSDTECPFCARFHPTMQQVIKEYDGKVKWIYRHFPLSFHANAQKEAEATECAAKLGGNDAFWSYTDKIYERTTSNGTGFALDKLVPLAKEIGLNESQFKKCLDSDEFAQKVKDQMAKGTEEGVSGTPGTIIMDSKGDTQFINGALPYDQIKPMIDSVLK